MLIGFDRKRMVYFLGMKNWPGEGWEIAPGTGQTIPVNQPCAMSRVSFNACAGVFLPERIKWLAFSPIGNWHSKLGLLTEPNNTNESIYKVK